MLVYSQKSFLIVDDFTDFRTSVRSMLREMGIRDVDTAESGETNGDAANGSGASDAGAAGDSAQDSSVKGDTATGDAVDSATGSDSTGDQAEGDDAAGDAAADDAEQDADAAVSEDAEAQADASITNLDELVELLEANGAESIVLKDDRSGISVFINSKPETPATTVIVPLKILSSTSPPPFTSVSPLYRKNNSPTSPLAVAAGPGAIL